MGASWYQRLASLFGLLGKDANPGNPLAPVISSFLAGTGLIELSI